MVPTILTYSGTDSIQFPIEGRYESLNPSRSPNVPMWQIGAETMSTQEQDTNDE